MADIKCELATIKKQIGQGSSQDLPPDFDFEKCEDMDSLMELEEKVADKKYFANMVTNPLLQSLFFYILLHAECLFTYKG